MNGRVYEFFGTKRGAECFCEVMNEDNRQAKFRELSDGHGTSVWIVWYSQEQAA